MSTKSVSSTAHSSCLQTEGKVTRDPQHAPASSLVVESNRQTIATINKHSLSASADDSATFASGSKPASQVAMELPVTMIEDDRVN